MKDKIRDMVRSILPSTARKSARDGKKSASRKARHNVRQELHDELYADHEDDNASGALHEIDRENRRDVRSVVRDRRGADKIGPFVRWAKEKTKNISEDDPKAKRDVIAEEIDAYSSVIKKHALDHFVPAYRLNTEAGSRYYGSRNIEVLVTAKEMRDAIRDAYERDHKGLNKILRYMGVYSCGYRSAWDYGYSYSRPTHRRNAPCYKVEKQEILSYTYRQIVTKDSSGRVTDTFLVRGSLTKPHPDKVDGEIQTQVYGYRDVVVHDTDACPGYYMVRDHVSLEAVINYFGRAIYHYDVQAVEGDALLVAYLLDIGALESQNPDVLAVIERQRKHLHHARSR